MTTNKDWTFVDEIEADAELERELERITDDAAERSRLRAIVYAIAASRDERDLAAAVAELAATLEKTRRH